MTKPKDNPRHPGDRGQGRRPKPPSERLATPIQVRLTTAQTQLVARYGRAVVAPGLPPSEGLRLGQVIRAAALAEVERWETMIATRDGRAAAPPPGAPRHPGDRFVEPIEEPSESPAMRKGRQP